MNMTKFLSRHARRRKSPLPFSDKGEVTLIAGRLEQRQRRAAHLRHIVEHRAIGCAALGPAAFEPPVNAHGGAHKSKDALRQPEPCGSAKRGGGVA